MPVNHDELLRWLDETSAQTPAKNPLAYVERERCAEFASAIRALQAENERLREAGRDENSRLLQLRADLARVTAERDEARTLYVELANLRQILTCAFCGHAYPPGTPPTQHEALTAHVMVCEKHPLRAQLAALAPKAEALDDCNRMAAAMYVRISQAPCQCSVVVSGAAQAIMCCRCLAMEEFERHRAAVGKAGR